MVLHEQNKKVIQQKSSLLSKGFEESGNTSDVWYLSDRNQWESAAEAFEKNDHILFALPLFVENISGTMLKFLEALPPKKKCQAQALPLCCRGGFPRTVTAALWRTIPGKCCPHSLDVNMQVH